MGLFTFIIFYYYFLTNLLTFARLCVLVTPLRNDDLCVSCEAFSKHAHLASCQNTIFFFLFLRFWTDKNTSHGTFYPDYSQKGAPSKRGAKSNASFSIFLLRTRCCTWWKCVPHVLTSGHTKGFKLRPRTARYLCRERHPGCVPPPTHLCHLPAESGFCVKVYIVTIF